MDITIKELADELGVSKTTISKVIADIGLQGQLRQVGNRFMLSETQAAAIRTKITQGSEPQTTAEPQVETQTEPPQMQTETETTLISLLESQISVLQQQLEIKDNQIAEKDAQLSMLGKSLQDTTAALTAAQDALQSTTAALTAAQALHAGTIQQQLTDRSGGSGEHPEDTVAADAVEQPKRNFWQRLFKKS